MVGKGSLETVYKAILDDSCIVVMKRLKRSNPCLSTWMLLGSFSIPKLSNSEHITYYAREEKLLVYDYMPNDSLHYLLRGYREPLRILLYWMTRIGLIIRAARGLEKIHDEYAASRIPHRNVK